jgi:hypothetical protein
MNSLSLPNNLKLNFIAYGSFKPDELRFNIIKEYVDSFKKTTISGLLVEKDGVPLFSPNQQDVVSAYELIFFEGEEKKAYQLISENEPNTFYKWSEIDQKNILLLNEKLKGVNYYMSDDWTFRGDPYFKEGLRSVDLISTNEIGKNTYETFFKLSSAYLLLWTIIERFCTLKYGNVRPTEKIKKMAEDKDINWELLLSNISRDDKIFRSDSNARFESISKKKGVKGALNYYYGIRSNVAHRGKSFDMDFKRIESSLLELKLIFEKILNIHNL